MNIEMKNTKIIPIGCDHAGFECKEAVKQMLEENGYEVKDYGAYSNERVDYPDFGHAVANHVLKNEGTLGIVICGSGNGINMTANKHQGIRSALCWTVEIAELARAHNDANMIALPARFVSIDLAKEMVLAFLKTNFEGERHALRVDKINC